MTNNTLSLKAFGGLAIKNADRGEVEAIVATLGVVDREGDIIRPGAIASGSKVKLSSYGHDAIYGAAPVGKGAVFVEGQRAIFRGRIFLATERGRETFTVLKELGAESEWSIGFRVVGSEVPDEAQRRKGAARILTKLDLLEVSPVLIGAGIGTGTTTVKQAAPPPANRRDPDELDREIATRGAVIANAMDRIFPQVPVETTVSASVQADAEAVAAWAAKRWGVVPPRVRWFTPSSHKSAGLFRFADPSAVWLKAGLAGEDLVRVTLHEASHHARHARGLDNSEHEVYTDEAALVRVFYHEQRFGWS
ncbi:MAG: HK97 family phage prohead protease [Gemmatimonadales bacterium]